MAENSTFARRNSKSGLIEIVDMYTGNVVAVQRSAFDLFNGHRELMVEYKLPSGEVVYMQKGIDPGLVAHVSNTPYNQIMVDIICQLVTEGHSLSAICKMDGMPTYATVCQWRRQNNHFTKQLEEARRDRAEYYRDKVVAEAEGAESTRDPINANNLRVESYKWAAGMDDARYSPKSKVEATLNTPVQILIDTGIDRRPVEREVSDDSDKTEMATALPDSAGSAALTSSGDCKEDHVEVHPVSGPAPEPRDDMAGG